MANARTYIESREVYRQIGDMLGVDLSKCRKAVIHLEAGGPVTVDLLGVPAEKPSNSMVDIGYCKPVPLEG